MKKIPTLFEREYEITKSLALSQLSLLDWSGF